MLVAKTKKTCGDTPGCYFVCVVRKAFRDPKTCSGGEGPHLDLAVVRGHERECPRRRERVPHVDPLYSGQGIAALGDLGRHNSIARGGGGAQKTSTLSTLIMPYTVSCTAVSTMAHLWVLKKPTGGKKTNDCVFC